MQTRKLKKILGQCTWNKINFHLLILSCLLYLKLLDLKLWADRQLCHVKCCSQTSVGLWQNNELSCCFFCWFEVLFVGLCFIFAWLGGVLCVYFYFGFVVLFFWGGGLVGVSFLVWGSGFSGGTCSLVFWFGFGFCLGCWGFFSIWFLWIWKIPA